MFTTRLLGFIALVTFTIPIAAFHLDPQGLLGRRDSCDGWGIWTSGTLSDCTEGISSTHVPATTATSATTTIDETSLIPLFLSTTWTTTITSTFASTAITTFTTTGVSTRASNSIGPNPCVPNASPPPGQSPPITVCDGKDCTTLSSLSTVSANSAHSVPTIAPPCPICSMDGSSVDATSSYSVIPPNISSTGSEHATTKTDSSNPSQTNSASATSKITSTHPGSSSVKGSEAVPTGSETPSTSVTGFSGGNRPLAAITSVLTLLAIQIVALW